MLCLVGNSPSSGSTLLADLLDSTPFSACGPELEFFCNRCVYEFSDYKANPTQISPIHSFKATGIRFRKDHLHQYNLDLEGWQKMLQESADLRQFAERFTAHFLHARGKSNPGIVFEKTPQNVNAIDLFLKAFPESYFIHIVRDPASVYWSLKRRGWGSLGAWATWLIYEAKMYPYLSHERCIIVNYKELIRHPFTITSDIINKIDPTLSCTPEIVKQGFKQNDYRKGVDSLKGWDNQNRSTIQQSVPEPPEHILEELSHQLDCQVNPTYAKRHKIAQVTLREVMDELGYEAQLDKLESFDNDEVIVPKPSLKDWRKIIPKWIKSINRGHGKVSDIKMLTKPIVPSA